MSDIKSDHYTRLLDYFRLCGNEPRNGEIAPIPHPDPEANRLMRNKKNSLRRAAVLIPVTRPEPELESQLVLTVRSDNLRSHAGQISLPGGTTEAQDSDTTATALRETEEEIGIHRDQIEVLGVLGDMALPSGFIITPVVGLIDAGLSYRACPDEVADIFQVPLSLALDANAYQNAEMRYLGKPRKIMELHYEDYRIWGATAAMLFHLASEIS